MPARDASISSALGELNKGHVLESIAQFKNVLRLEPGNASAYFYLSTLYTELKKFEVAERDVRRAMELAPGQAMHYRQLGLIRYRQSQWRPALEFFDRALKLGAGNNESAVWRNIGDVQVELFDRDAALHAYETSLRLQPKDTATQLSLGRFYLDRSEPAQAIQHLVAALESDPQLRAAYPALGRAYRQSGDLPSAIAILKKSLEADPADQESRYALGQILLAAGRADEGRVELSKYQTIREQVAKADGAYDTALTLIDARRFAEAEKLLREAVQLAPNYGPALHSLGTLLLDRGSPDKAVDFLKRAVKVNPLNSATWFRLGTAFFRTGKLAEALEAANWAVVLDEDDTQYLQLLRDIQARKQR